MTSAVAGNSPGTECLCSMCKCGKHNCPQQYQIERPTSLVKSSEGPLLYQNVPQINYYTTTYRSDFDPEQQPDVPDLEVLQNDLECSEGPLGTQTGYCKDIANKICQSAFNAKEGNKNVPMHPELASMSSRTIEKLCQYYCPPHCVGTEKREEEESCLTQFRDKFVLGPPQRKKKSTPNFETSREPFAKHTSYKLDFVHHQVEPRKPKEPPAVPPPLPPTSYATTHKQAFGWPEDPPGHQLATGRQPTNIPFGEGPMVRESSHMVDFQAPRGGQPTSIVRPDRRAFRPPAVRMEGDTTTGDAYRRWKVLPPNPAGKPHLQQSHWAPTDDGDTRCRVSTYQEDFDGVCAALCPAKMIENYGPKILEPSYNFVGSSNEHDFYRPHCFELINKK